MAINYYRTVLGIGVSLMTMQLIVGIGVQFLQDLVASTSQNLDASQLGILLCAVIILAETSHRLPHIVAGMVVGAGHNGAIGGVGVMTLFAAGMTGMSLAGRPQWNPAAMLATEGVGEGAKMLQQDRIAAAEAAMSGQKSQASSFSATSDGPVVAASASTGSSSSGSGKASPMSWYSEDVPGLGVRPAEVRPAIPVVRSRLAPRPPNHLKSGQCRRTKRAGLVRTATAE